MTNIDFDFNRSLEELEIERNGVLKALDEQGNMFLAHCGIAEASQADHGRPVKDEELTDDNLAALAAKFSHPA